jgi:sortase A
VNRRKVWAATLAVVGVCCTIQGGWIHAKAALAQILLERAWSETAGGRGPIRPWPWADTHPVGRLQVPAHGVDLVVLAGATGRTLAFAPGHLSGSAAIGAPGNAVVAGHRDTHFAFLKHLRTGEEIRTESAEGRVQAYRVIGSR